MNSYEIHEQNRRAVDSLIEASVNKHKTYAYVAGLLGSILVEVMSEMTESRRDQMIRSLNNFKDDING